MWRNLAKAVRELEKTCNEALDPYRPELHYMRGPGPRWHAKRGTGMKAAANMADAVAVRRKIARTHA